MYDALLNDTDDNARAHKDGRGPYFIGVRRQDVRMMANDCTRRCRPGGGLRCRCPGAHSTANVDVAGQEYGRRLARAGMGGAVSVTGALR
jgi:hypothetical protein